MAGLVGGEFLGVGVLVAGVFAALSQEVEAEVAALFGPLVGLLGQDGAHQVGEGVWVGEDAVVPPRSRRASLCGVLVGGRGGLVVDRAHHVG